MTGDIQFRIAHGAPDAAAAVAYAALTARAPAPAAGLWSAAAFETCRGDVVRGEARIPWRRNGDGELVGLAFAQRIGATAELLQLACAPEARRRRIASRLITLLATELSNLGSSELLLEVAETNAPACKLYRGLGFVRVGRRSAYYRQADGSRISADVLSKPLGVGK